MSWLDPMIEIRTDLALPKGDIRLKPVHGVINGIERFAPVRSGRTHEHNRLTGHDLPASMYDRQARDAESLHCVTGDTFKGSFTQSRIPVEFEKLNDLIVSLLPNDSNESCHRAAMTKRVKKAGLKTHDIQRLIRQVGLKIGNDHPPENTEKNATSSPSDSGWSIRVAA